MSAEYTTVLPSARRLMASLRDIGYDLPAAIADIVDNSIDAGAENISIDAVDHGVDSYIRIVDDGLGMSSAQLDEAMRYGSASEYKSEALGHFGLGLKTASLSQCRRLTVASRRGASSRISIRRWDLDTVAAMDAWALEAPRPRDAPEHLAAPLADRAGTVVLWEHLDRILAFKTLKDGYVRRALAAVAADVAEHLAMTFHRFISGEATDHRRFVTIRVNGVPVAPWDPFARSERASQKLKRQTVDLDPDGLPGVAVEVQPYVLPAQTEFSSAEAHQQAAGPAKWNRQQGFYIYRRERLVQSGGWNRLRTFDEHAKLARIAVDLPIGHEHLFGINVAKMSVSLPEALRPTLRTLASAVVQTAQRRYRELTPEPVVPTPPTNEDGGRLSTISGDWPLISDTVERVLGSDPVARDRLLRELANAYT